MTRELDYVRAAIESGKLAGNGPWSKRCADYLTQTTGTKRAFVTHSATAALEMAALLADLEPGDEVIMPSFTFVSTATAIVLRGATPVFVDVRSDTLNIDETLIPEAISNRTRAIISVHYAGVAADMDAIMTTAAWHGLRVIEDASQGLGATYKGRTLGTIGDAGAISFHETKNVTCGEGGALLVNLPDWLDRAEAIYDKGTDRAEFLRGETDRYTWTDVGSSFLLGEIPAAYLAAQLEREQSITLQRRVAWEALHEWLEPLAQDGFLRRPTVPEGCEHNGHIYWVLLPTDVDRDHAIADLADRGVQASFHYVPLHSSPAGRRYGMTVGSMAVTDDVSARLIRLPLTPGRAHAVAAALEEVLG